MSSASPPGSSPRSTPRPRALVLEAPLLPSVVFRREAGREGRVLDALGRIGAAVPPVVAIDAAGDVLARPCFVMEHVDGRSLEDTSWAGYHDDPWLQALTTREQRSIWDSFYDALGRLHRADPSTIDEADLLACGSADVISYWRDAVLDVAPPEAVPRQLALLDWLITNLQPRAEDDLAVCMGDARTVNGLVRELEIRTLLDFEVAYLGNPAADVGYSVFVDELQRTNAATPLTGAGTADEGWARWAAATGRDTELRAYWTAFGAMVLGVTATRAMVQWGLAGPSLEADNPVVAMWEQAVGRAAHR
jgi:aminoglycoside phosphotransferase (APT) family kinase protein